jgi:hypothetical protein
MIRLTKSRSEDHIFFSCIKIGLRNRSRTNEVLFQCTSYYFSSVNVDSII